MTINVTQAHIDAGKSANCEKCPIALAFLDEGYTNVSVGCKTVYASKDGNMSFGYLPTEAMNFIKDFDHGYKCAPFSFSFEFRT